MEESLKTIVDFHLRNCSDILSILFFRKLSKELNEICLLEVDSTIPDRVELFYETGEIVDPTIKPFRYSKYEEMGVFFNQRVFIVNSSDFSKIKENILKLPAGWDLLEAEVIFHKKN